MTIEQISAEAHAKYNDALKKGASKENALNVVLDFLKAQENVKEVKVTGSDTVRVFFADGNDLLLMLGKERM